MATSWPRRDEPSGRWTTSRCPTPGSTPRPAPGGRPPPERLGGWSGCLVSMGRPGGGSSRSRPVMVNMAHDRHASPTAVDDGSIQVRSPKTLVTARPYSVTVPAQLDRGQEPVVGVHQPELDQEELVEVGGVRLDVAEARRRPPRRSTTWCAACPRTGRSSGRSSVTPAPGRDRRREGGPVSVAPATSKPYQSRCPPWYSSAISVRGPVGVGAERATRYSRCRESHERRPVVRPVGGDGRTSRGTGRPGCRPCLSRSR